MRRGQLRIPRFLIAAVLVAALLLAPRARPVQAGGVVGTGTPGSCTEAALDAALVGGGTIAFNCGPGPQTILISSQKSINVDTTIDGGGKITLDGQDAYRLFDVGALLTLRNIVLTRAYFNGDGGAIRNNSNGALVLENSTIRDSRATLSGGAILSTGPLTITNSLLQGNQALNGGALYPRFSGARTTIVNSVLRYNHATDTTDGWGGAILAWDGAPVTIEGGDIYSNTAQSGGGIYNFSNSVLTLKSNTWLRDNVATAYGSGVYNEGTVTMTNVTLSGNSANFSGGLFNVGIATLTNVTFSNNKAYNDGGGLYNLGTATLTNATLGGNSAGSNGGGLYNDGTTTLTSVTLSGNSASSGGGGVFNVGAASLTNVTLSDNSAVYGGGLYNEVGEVELHNVTLSGNSASSGGGLYNSSGGATLTHVTLSGNSASNGGGLFISSGGVTLSNVTLGSNSATHDGGGLYNDSSSTVTLTNVTLSGNSASIGGGLYNLATAELTNVTLNGNSAGSRGGGLYNQATAELTNVTLSGNSAGIGGGLYNGDINSTARLTFVTLSGNAASAGLGQSIFRDDGSVIVRATILANSSSGEDCVGGVTDDGFNVTSDATCGLGTVPDVMLGPLANNGGPTLTHMPLPGSPAIDRVFAGYCPPPATDQRGAARPVGAACDAGAVEYGAILPMVYMPVVLK